MNAIKIKAVIPYVGHANPNNNPEIILKRIDFKKFKLLIINFVKALFCDGSNQVFWTWNIDLKNLS